MNPKILILLFLCLCLGLAGFILRQPNATDEGHLSRSVKLVKPTGKIAVVDVVTIEGSEAEDEIVSEHYEPYDLLMEFSRVQEIAPNDSPGQHDHIIKEWKGILSPNVASLANGIGLENTSLVIRLALPDELGVYVRLLKKTQFAESQGVIQGEIVGHEMSEVYLSYVNEAVSGTIIDPVSKQVIEIRNAGNGYQYIALVDADKLGECAICTELEEKG